MDHGILIVQVQDYMTTVGQSCSSMVYVYRVGLLLCGTIG